MTDSFRVQVYRWKTRVGLQQTKVSCAARSCVENSRLPVQIMTAQITGPKGCGNFSVLMFSESTVTAQDVNFGTQCLIHLGKHRKTMSISPRQALQDNVNWTSANTARQCQFHLGKHCKTMLTGSRQTLQDNVNFTSASTARQGQFHLGNIARQGQIHLGNHGQTRSTSPRKSQPDKVNFTSAITARQWQALQMIILDLSLSASLPLNRYDVD